MGQGNAEQIERRWHYHGRHGGGNRCRYASQLKKYKNQSERRKGKKFVVETTTEFNGERYEDYEEIAPQYEDTYGKYCGWEF